MKKAILAGAFLAATAADATTTVIPLKGVIDTGDEGFTVPIYETAYTSFTTDSSLTPADRLTQVHAEVTTDKSSNFVTSVMCRLDADTEITDDVVKACQRGTGIFSGSGVRYNSKQISGTHNLYLSADNSKDREQFLIDIVGWGRTTATDSTNTGAIRVDFRDVGPALSTDSDEDPTATTKLRGPVAAPVAPVAPAATAAATAEAHDASLTPFTLTATPEQILSIKYTTPATATLAVQDDAIIAEVRLLAGVDPARFHFNMESVDTNEGYPADNVPLYSFGLFPTQKDATDVTNAITQNGAYVEGPAPIVSMDTDLCLPGMTSFWIRISLLSDNVNRPIVVSARLSHPDSPAPPPVELKLMKA